MAEELRVLMLEDEPADAEFAQRELRKGGMLFTSLRVDERNAFLAALDEFRPDIILADYKLPSFDGLAALSLAREKAPKVPFIFVSGAMGEEFAIETLHQGAADYVLKGHLSKLVPAVNRALLDAEEHRRRQEAEASLKESEERFRNMAESAQDGIVIVDAQGAVNYWNAAAERMFGYRQADLAGRRMAEIIVPAGEGDQAGKGWPESPDGEQGAGLGATFEARGVHQDGHVFPIELSLSSTPIKGRWHVIGIVRDIGERKRAEVALRRSNRFLRTLSRCNETLVHASDEDELLHNMCRVVVEVGEFALAWVGIVEESGVIRSVAKHGSCGGLIDAVGLEGSDAEEARRPVVLAVSSGETHVVQDISESSSPGWRDQALSCGYRSAISLPLRVAGKIIGALSIYASEPGAFGSEEVSLLTELAGDLGFGIATIRVRAEREEDARKLERALEDTIQAIATTIEARDPYTAGHQRRVAQLAAAIAREMGLAEHRVTGVLRGAEIHDIGKIYIPSEILSRPGRLSSTEFSLIKIHPQVGYDIVKEIDFPWPVAAMILQHHERLDGSGYPRGLKGSDQIILEAKILAVADVVDAMVSHRPYRAALGVDAALDEIVRNRGALYDENVVDICVRLFREMNFEFA
ncbi:MAG TPA: HD domain-containing phosphohydrolase [Rhodocyclaceae bacterium]